MWYDIRILGYDLNAGGQTKEAETEVNANYKLEEVDCEGMAAAEREARSSRNVPE